MVDTPDMDSLQALIFDVDGTLADTEELHRQAFNLVFSEYSIPWRWSPRLYERLLAISGGRERIDFYMRELLAKGPGEILTPDLIREIHGRKTAIYGELIRAGHLKLRPGVARLLDEARAAGLTLALATSSARRNLDTLLDMNLPADWRDWFAAIETCDSVPEKKPSPAVYLAVLRAIGLPAAHCVAFEDTLNGLKTARAAGLATVITTHRYTRARAFPGAALVTDGLGEPEAPCRIVSGELGKHDYVTLAGLRRLLAAPLREPRRTGSAALHHDAIAG